MSYAADGPLDPPLVEETAEYFLPDVMGYKVLVTEWSDETYTMNIFRIDEWNSEHTIEDGEVTYESRPSEEDILLIILETIEERADKTMQ